MHRAVKGRHLLCRSAEVNGTKTKSLRYRCVKSLTDSKRTGQGKRSLLGSQSLYIGVLSDDFSAVDVREVLCYHSRPKKRKFKRYNERQKPIKRKPCAAEKRQPIPKRVSGDGSAPPRFLVAVNFAFGRLAFATRPFCSVTSPLPKKSLLCKSFSGALFHSVFRVVLVVFFVACAWLRRAQRAALVYAKHTPRCQSSN